jgi:hypothetical protein
MQQTYGGITRAIAPVLYGRAFDSLGVASPYYFSSAIIAATIFLGFGLDKYARADSAAAQPAATGAGLAASDAQPSSISNGAETVVAATAGAERKS